jgi:hypothetical protein
MELMLKYFYDKIGNRFKFSWTAQMLKMEAASSIEKSVIEFESSSTLI